MGACLGEEQPTFNHGVHLGTVDAKILHDVMLVFKQVGFAKEHEFRRGVRGGDVKDEHRLSRDAMRVREHPLSRTARHLVQTETERYNIKAVGRAKFLRIGNMQLAVTAAPPTRFADHVRARVDPHTRNARGCARAAAHVEHAQLLWDARQEARTHILSVVRYRVDDFGR